MRQLSAVEQEALAAFKEQRVKLDSIADKDVHDPAFISWKTVTTEVFERYLPESAFRSRLGGHFKTSQWGTGQNRPTEWPGT